MRLACGQSVYSWGAASYNKLRRGTAVDIRYALSIRPDACFALVDDPSKRWNGWRVLTTVSPGLNATVVKQTEGRKHSQIKGVNIPNCFVEVTVRVRAPADHPLGMQSVSGRIQWQAITKDGPQPAQSSGFDFPVEVVEHDDRTVQYNESCGYRPKPDLLWHIPALPFVLVYCAIAGGDGPD